jgi:hypothetical protein
MLYLSPRPDAALTSTSGNGQWRSQVDQSHRIVLTLTTDTPTQASHRVTREFGKNAHRAVRFWIVGALL